MSKLTRSGFEKLSKQELASILTQVTHDIEFVKLYPNAQKLCMSKLQLLIQRVASR